MFRPTTLLGRRLSPAAAILLVCLCSPHAFADHASSRCETGPWTQGLKVGPGMDASGRILRGCVFVGLDLRGANFEDADLGGCELFQCDLRNASFKDAILTGLRWDDCDVKDADFSGALFNGAVPLNRIHAYHITMTAEQVMSTRSYRTKHLTNCVFALRLVDGKFARPKFDFRDANLRDATFKFCDLRDSDFANAKIIGAQFHQCWIGAAQITATDEFRRSRELIGIHFSGVDGHVDLSRCNLYGSSNIPSDADLTNAIIRRCTLGRGISRGQLESTKSYKKGVLRDVSFLGLDLRNADFSGMDLAECLFQDCDLANASFEDAVITNVNFQVFRTSDLHLTLDQIKSTWNYKHGRMAGIRLPEELAKAIETEAEDGP